MIMRGRQDKMLTAHVFDVLTFVRVNGRVISYSLYMFMAGLSYQDDGGVTLWVFVFIMSCFIS